MAEGRDREARRRLRARRDAGRLEQLGASLDARRPDDDPGDQRAITSSVIEAQRKRLGTKRGFVAVKPNCSIQSYVPAIHPLWRSARRRSRCARIRRSPAPARRSRRWPEMVDNVIPFIKGEEEKSEQEPLKIWGTLDDGQIVDGDRARDHRAVHSRAGQRWPHGGGVRRVREEAVARADPRRRGRSTPASRSS